VPRFSYALLGALALHGLAALLRAPHSRDAASLLAKAQPAAQALDLEEFPIEEAEVVEAKVAAPSPPAEPLAATAAANRVASPLAKATSAEIEPTSEAAPAGDALAMPVAAGSEAAGDAPPARKIDLGLDGHFFLHAPGPGPGPATAPGPAAAAELGPRARKSNAQRQLEAAMSADDIQRGLARGNALLGSLHSAARAEGPQRGEAIFRATVAADGSFANVELLGGTLTEWSAVLSAFRKLAASKHVRLPPGAKGLRVTFSVKAKVQRPSGKEVNQGAVHVDTPSATPAGIGTSGDFDLADLGGGSQRLVYARVVSEEVL